MIKALFYHEWRQQRNSLGWIGGAALLFWIVALGSMSNKNLDGWLFALSGMSLILLPIMYTITMTKCFAECTPFSSSFLAGMPVRPETIFWCKYGFSLMIMLGLTIFCGSGFLAIGRGSNFFSTEKAFYIYFLALFLLSHATMFTIAIEPKSRWLLALPLVIVLLLNVVRWSHPSSGCTAIMFSVATVIFLCLGNHVWTQQIARGKLVTSDAPLSAFLLLAIVETIVVCADKMFKGI